MDRIRATAIFRLILFALGMVAISLVIVRAGSQPISTRLDLRQLHFREIQNARILRRKPVGPNV